MDNPNPHIERTGQRLTFVSRTSVVVQLAGMAFLAAASFVFATGNSDTLATPGNTAGMVVVLVFFGCILVANSTRRWTLEVDLVKRRLRLTRQFLNLWTRTIVDCPFDQCRALGIIIYEAEGRTSCSAYFQLKNSQRHAIPLHKMTFTEITAFIQDLSAETGIPIEETPMVDRS